jgi:flagellar basal-body rod protein FlgB
MGFKMEHVFQVMEASLNGSTARQSIIAHNISNINTPGFKRFLTNFEDQLNNPSNLPLKITNSNHIGNNESEIGVERDTSPGLRADGNNVDLEKEMTAMVKNDIYFNAVLNQLNKKIAMQKYVLSDGKG